MKCLILLTLFIAGCTTQLPNGCLIEATSYKYSTLAKNKLPNGFAKILIVEYKNEATSHCYCVFSTNGSDLHCYDAYLGSIDLLSFKTPLSIALYVTSLSNALYDTKNVVSNAYYLD